MFFPLQKGYQDFVAITSKEIDSLVLRLESMPAHLAVSRLREIYRHYTNELDIQRMAGKNDANGVTIGGIPGPVVIAFHHKVVDLTPNNSEPHKIATDQCDATISCDSSVVDSAATCGNLSRDQQDLGNNQRVKSTNRSLNSEYQPRERSIIPEPSAIKSGLPNYRCPPLKSVLSDLIALRNAVDELAKQHPEGSSDILG